MRWTILPLLPLAAALVGGTSVACGFALSRPTAETKAFNSVYYTALLAGRDPDAAVRKARFTTAILMKQLGESRSQATADVTKFMVWRAGSLCGG